jgi:hypothetical protein
MYVTGLSFWKIFMVVIFWKIFTAVIFQKKKLTKKLRNNRNKKCSDNLHAKAVQFRPTWRLFFSLLYPSMECNGKLATGYKLTLAV